MAPREARTLALDFADVALTAAAPSQRGGADGYVLEEERAEPSLSWREQIQAFVFEYGLVGMCTHIVLSLLWFAGIYAGIVSGVAVSSALQLIGFADSAASNSAGSFILTFSIYKALTPVRWTVTLAVMPIVVRTRRLIRNSSLPWPLLQPASSSEQLPLLA